MSPMSMDRLRWFCAVFVVGAWSGLAGVLAEDPARSLKRDAHGTPPSPSGSPEEEPGWTVISDGLLADLERGGKKPDWPGKTTGVAADRTTGEVFVLLPGQGVWGTSEGGVKFERVDGGNVSGRCETGWSINMDPGGNRRVCFMLDGPSADTFDGGKTWSGPLRQAEPEGPRSAAAPRRHGRPADR